MKQSLFNPGFRLSALDVCIIIAGLLGAFYVRPFDINFSLIILFVVGHFFIFCNITRMSRIPELIWAASFLVLCTASIRLSILPLYLVFFISGMITIFLIVYELRKVSYHGIFWQNINPNLKAWFEAKKS